MNYYEILGVKRTATQDEIKTAYKKLVKKYHPDIYTGDKDYAQKMTSQINVAYDTLSVPEERAKYDEETFPTYTYTPPTYNNTYNEDSNTSGSGYSGYSSTGYRNPYSTSSYGASRGYNNSKDRTYAGYNSYRYGAYTNTYTNTKDGSEHDYTSYKKYENVHQSNYKHSHTPFSNFQDSVFSNQQSFENFNKLRMIFVVLVAYLVMMFIFVGQYNRSIRIAESRNISSDTSNTIYSYYSSSNSTNSTTARANDLSQKYPKCYSLYSDYQLRRLYSEFKSNYRYEIPYEEFLSYFEEYLTEGGY